MKTKIIAAFLLSAVCLFQVKAQVIPISQARASAIGQTVTVTGIVTNGSELGNIRYLQDGTGGLAAFSSSLAPVMRGDEITVTGVLYDYNNLLELSPVNSFTINGSGIPMPAPVVLTPSQLSETYEGQLVQVNGVVFANGGQSFAGSTNYNYTASGQSGQIRINAGTNLVGTVIPTGTVNVTGILSQYQSTYQLLPRDINDVVLASSFFITSQPVQTNISTTGFDVNWTTNLNSSSYIQYGHTPNLELGMLTGNNNTTNHTVTISGANASELFYVRAYSVSGSDTAVSYTRLFITASNSTGQITCYFNKSVENSVSTIQNAVQLPGTIDDTLIAYINRAQQSIDISIYNFDQTNLSDIASAINNRFNAGVQVRIIYNSSTTNPALALLDPGIYTLGSPTSSQYGIMHNKFVVIDANASDPNLAIVWTGSTNWNENQVDIDANNVIIIQDKSLAKAYTLEFEEMWGSSTNIPNGVDSKFGPYKTDNTPHEFSIGGKRVQCFFSPSDNVTQEILNTVQTANTQLFFEVLSFTRTDIATAIATACNNGVFGAGMVEDTANAGGPPFNIIYAAIGNRMMVYDHNINQGILHHKYMIVDQDNVSSDPMVLTGSHNWSNSAQGKNDENIVIVHDANIANQYYQEFYKRFLTNGGLLGVNDNNSNVTNYLVYPVPNHGWFYVQYQLKQHATGTIFIRDVMGKEVYAATQSGQTGNNFLMIDEPTLSAGLYFIELNFGGKSIVNKLVIE